MIRKISAFLLRKLYITAILLFCACGTGWAAIVIDSDWSGGNFQNTSRIETDAEPGLLLLLNYPDDLVFAFDPTPDDVVNPIEYITDAAEYEDRLYLVAETDMWGAPRNGAVYVYDYRTDSSSFAYQPASVEGLKNINVIDGTIYLPEHDPTVSWSDGVLHTFDGIDWTRHFYPGMQMTHGYRVVNYFDELYFFYSGEVVRDCLCANGISDNCSCSHGKVSVSQDEGQSWELLQKWHEYDVNDWIGLREAVVFQGRLFAGSPKPYDFLPDLYVYDGFDWDEITVSPYAGGINALAVFNDILYIGLRSDSWRKNYNNALNTDMNFIITSDDGETFTEHDTIINSLNNYYRVLDFCTYKTKLFTIVYKLSGDTAEPSRVLFETEDGTYWTEAAELPGTLADGKIHDANLTEYKGRLYAMFPDYGDVYVSAAASSGSLVSKPKNIYTDIDSGLYYLCVNGFEPAGTSIKLQVKIAQTEAGLNDKPFTGPDGSAESYYTPGTDQTLPGTFAGNLWIQYKLFFETADTSKTPYLEELYIEKDTDGDGVLDDIDNCIDVPNADQSDSDLDGVGDTCENVLVELDSFDALAGNREVILIWSTSSEIDTAGYNIYRSDSAGAEYIRLNKNIIPAEGTPAQGALYDFRDGSVKNRSRYWYILEDVDRQGNATQHGPVTAIPRLMYNQQHSNKK